MKKIFIILLLLLPIVLPANAEDQLDNKIITMKENFQSYPIELRKLVVSTINSFEKTLTSPNFMVEAQLTETKSKIDEIIISYQDYSKTEFIHNFKVLHTDIRLYLLSKKIFNEETAKNKEIIEEGYTKIENTIKGMRISAGLW